MRFLALVRKEFRHMLRDPWALAIVTVGAALLLVLMAYTFSADIENVPIAVVDADSSPRSRAFLLRLDNDPFFDVRHWVRSYEAGLAALESGEVQAVVVVSPVFDRSLQEGSAAVQLLVDGTEPNTAHQILGNAEALSAGFALDVLRERLAAAGLASSDEALPLEFRVQALYNAELKEVRSILPGLMSVILAMPALSAALSLAKEREQGSLEGLMATPIGRAQLLAGKVAPYVLIGVLDVFLFTVVALVLFDVPFRGRVVDLVLFAGLFLLANLGVGLLVCSLARTQVATLVIAGLIFVMPSINESGLFYPLYAMSSDARAEALLWPATHFVTIARGLFLKGAEAHVLMSDGLYLLACGLVLNALAAWRIQKKVR